MYQAKDGSRFDPVSCRRPGSGKYWVGPKGSERSFTFYAAAQAYLDAMPWCDRRWRRPNRNGNWGIVKAVAVI